MKLAVTLLALASIASADRSATPSAPPLVVLAYVTKDGKQALEVYGISTAGRLMYRKSLGSTSIFNAAADDRCVVITDAKLAATLCLDRLTGKELWRQKREGTVSDWVSVTIAGRCVFVSGQGQKSRAFSLQSGALQKEYDLGGWADVSEDRRTVLVQDYKSRQAVAIDAVSLKTLWTRELGKEDSMAFCGPHLFVDHGGLALVDPRTFKQVQPVRLSVPVNSWAGASRAGEALIVNIDGALSRIDGSGAAAWTRTFDSSNTYLAGSSATRVMLVQHDQQVRVRALDVKDGREVWTSIIEPDRSSMQTDQCAMVSEITFSMAGETAWLMHADRREITIHDLSTGEVRSTVKQASHVRQLLHDRGRVYALTENALVGYVAGTGALRWSVPLDGPIVAGTLIVK